MVSTTHVGHRSVVMISIAPESQIMVSVTPDT